PLTFIILLVAFGAFVAAVIPLILAVTSLAAAFGILGIYSQVVGPVSVNATQLIVLIGLAVAVDYSLSMVTRFRTEPRRRGDRVNFGRPVTWVPRLVSLVPVAVLRSAGRRSLAALDRRAQRPEGSGFWGGLVTAVMRRPIVLTLATTAILLLVAAPVLRLQT